MKACYFLLTPDCNLHCRYCFQHEGCRGETSPRTAGAVADHKTIERFAAFCRRSRIERVEFFGGEPLLYRNAFLYAGRTLLDKVPGLKLGLVTNGTLIDESVMRFLEQAPVSVLLSLDGKRARQNRLRGRFDSIAPWFARLAAKGHTTVAMQVGLVENLFEHVRFIWQQGFPSVYLNIIQSYGWYGPGDADCFESEYEKSLKAMLAGKGELVCALSLHRTLAASRHESQCGITQTGLACDWRGLLYPCHRAPELGERFAIGDVGRGICRAKEQRWRTQIHRQCFQSVSARKYHLVSFCPITVHQRYGKFSGKWSDGFCELINRKAKIVAKYHYQLEAYCGAQRRVSQEQKSVYLNGAE